MGEFGLAWGKPPHPQPSSILNQAGPAQDPAAGAALDTQAIQ